MRNRAGEMQYLPDSIFLNEIPSELMEINPVKEGVISCRCRKPQKSSGKVSFQTSDLKDKIVRPGSIVSHKIFGPGKVLDITGVGQNAKLRIHFRTCGTKTIVAKFVEVK